MSRQPRRTLAFRLAMLGVVQLVLLATAVVGVGFLIEPERHPESFDAPPPPPPLEPFGPGGPDAPPPPPPGDRPGGKHHGPRGALPPLVTFFVSGLVIVGIGSLLTARWIVGPLDALTRASRSLGAGDLRARTGLVRSDELGELGRSFDDMAERVQSLLLSERELLANVSHELRTPLARIRVALDIASEADGQSGRASLADIAVDLSEIEALIDDILTTTRLDIAAGRGDPSAFALHPQDVTAEVLCRRASERFQVRHPLRKLEIALAQGLPSVNADPVLFRRVLDNLLENAHKYSPDASTSVALRVTAGEGTMLFEVADRGLGISAEDLPRVFTPFFRGERSRSRGTGGVVYVEDDDRLGRLTAQYLGSHGIEVVLVPRGDLAVAEVLRVRPDVVLLDLMLPGRDGLEICRALRERVDVPIIMVTARTEEADRVMGLEGGADDYVPKPFSSRELLARIRAQARRAAGKAGPSLARAGRAGGARAQP